MSPVTKDPSIILGNSSERWNADQLFQYLTCVAGWPEGEAIGEMQEKFERERLPLKWRRTDPEGIGQEGIIPDSSFLRRQLCVARDFNSDKKHGPIDFATGKVAVGNDGRAFIQVLQASISATYALTVPAWLARSLWPPRLMSEQSKAPAATSAEQLASSEPAPTVQNPTGTVPNQVSRNKHKRADAVAPKTKKNRVKSLLPDLDKQGRFKPGMKPHEIEEIVVPVYKKKLGEDVPSRDQIWRAYTDYRETHPLS
jgi:hypothetical protein